MSETRIKISNFTLVSDAIIGDDLLQQHKSVTYKFEENLSEFCISSVNEKLARVTSQPIDETKLLTVETNASDFAIAATLNQNGKPVAFHVPTLSASEQTHSSVEKEAYICHY